MSSLRRRLLLWFLTLSLIGWAGTTLVTWYRLSDEMDEIYDAQLMRTTRQLAQMLIPLLEDEKRPPAQRITLARTLLDRMIALPMNDPYMAQFLARGWWHGQPLTGEAGPLPPRHSDPAVRNETQNGKRQRRYRFYDVQHDLLVEVTELHNARALITREFAETVVLPLLILGPLLGLAAWVTVRRGLEPLKCIVREIEQRSLQDLSHLQEAKAPREVAPMVKALNRLLERVREGIDREQRFTADASHELRTPLAGLRVQAQLALRSTDASQRARALEQLIAGIDRSTHVVEQLLTMARMDPGHSISRRRQEAIRPLLEETVASITTLIEQKQLHVEIGGDDADALVDREALLILLRNLLDNAARYTPEQGEIRVECREQGQSTVLEIHDSGPGIPAKQRGRLLEPFQRGEQRDISGCGLGLSIVQRIVAMHSGSLELGSSPLGGLAVTITLPGARNVRPRDGG